MLLWLNYIYWLVRPFLLYPCRLCAGLGKLNIGQRFPTREPQSPQLAVCPFVTSAQGLVSSTKQMWINTAWKIKWKEDKKQWDREERKREEGGKKMQPRPCSGFRNNAQMVRFTHLQCPEPLTSHPWTGPHTPILTHQSPHTLVPMALGCFFPVKLCCFSKFACDAGCHWWASGPHVSGEGDGCLQPPPPQPQSSPSHHLLPGLRGSVPPGPQGPTAPHSSHQFQWHSLERKLDTDISFEKPPFPASFVLP